MNIIEVVFFILMLGIGWLLAKAIYPIGGFWFAVGGFVVGFVTIPMILFAYGRYRRWAYRGDKFTPDCSCGSSEFKYKKVGREYHLLCQQCKTRCERRPDAI